MVLWVFGYGSLVWNPGFQEEEKIVGYIKGYKRNFDLGCIDHRGTPQLPARTCALDADKESVCWGTALCVSSGDDPEKERMVMEYLESRECEHNIKAYVDFYKEEEEEEGEGESALPFLTNILVFTATPDKLINKYYLGPASLEDTATQIARAAGPCGNNKDYLFKLEEAMVRIGHVDDFVIELANEVRKILAGTVPCS